MRTIWRLHLNYCPSFFSLMMVDPRKEDTDSYFFFKCFNRYIDVFLTILIKMRLINDNKFFSNQVLIFDKIVYTIIFSFLLFLIYDLIYAVIFLIALTFQE